MANSAWCIAYAVPRQTPTHCRAGRRARCSTLCPSPPGQSQTQYPVRPLRGCDARPRAPRSGREPRPDAPFGCAREGETAGPTHPSGVHARARRPPGTARHTVPAQYPLAPPARAGVRSGQVCPAGRAGVRSACTVPHTVPASFREAHVGRCPGVLPGSRTKSRWVCGSIPAEGPRRGKRRACE
jgi:hypothetical protein